MAIISMKNARVGTRGGNVTLIVPVDGRSRTLNLEPSDAVQIANQIATAAIEITPVEAPASMQALDFSLKPYDGNGLAHLAILTEHGPFVFALDATGLAAFAASAEAALEFAPVKGSV